MTTRIKIALSDFFLWRRSGDFSNFSALCVGDTVNDVRLTNEDAVGESCISQFVFDGCDLCVCCWNRKFGTIICTQIVNAIFELIV